jgi:chromosome segregation and condensation protein ScpB
MKSSDFAIVADAIAWPGVALFAIVLFYPRLARIFDGLASSMKITKIKLTAFGVEAELAVREVKEAVNELLQEISNPTNELSRDELTLLDQISMSEGRKSVIELDATFVRGSDVHKRLQRLRDSHFIRPFEGGRWLAEKHPVITRFGRLVLDLRSKARS